MLEVRIPFPVAAPPLEPTTPIKPSEAIRLGCLLAPVQAFGSFRGQPSSASACVLGAMNLGFGFGVESVAAPFWRQLIAFSKNPCPVPRCRKDAWPPHLNDDHRWSRERIADWLEGLGR